MTVDPPRAMPDPASFRDPSGCVYRLSSGRLLRQVNRSYEPHYRTLMSSGLYDVLAKKGLLVPHVEEDKDLRLNDNAVAVLAPREIPMITYPYEWCYSQYQAAALLTLEIQTIAMKHGMTLKDATAYNVQFEGTHPRFIDTLSFELRGPTSPWRAYYQFCKHFLAPLALMAYTDPTLNALTRVHLDGIPLPLAARLMPGRSRCRFGLLLHLFAHARANERWYRQASATVPVRETVSRGMSARGVEGLVESLHNTILKLPYPNPRGKWVAYYQTDPYEEQDRQAKERFLLEVLSATRPKRVCDLGANTGVYSRLAARYAAYVIAVDNDWASVETNYQTCQKEAPDNVLPLTVDLTNPSPPMGWACEERSSFFSRAKADLVMALALTHHLAISNNVLFSQMAKVFHALSERDLIVEFVDAEDPQVRRLLRQRGVELPMYHRQTFEKAFASMFRIRKVCCLPRGTRVLYWMQRHSA